MNHFNDPSITLFNNSQISSSHSSHHARAVAARCCLGGTLDFTLDLSPPGEEISIHFIWVYLKLKLLCDTSWAYYRCIFKAGPLLAYCYLYVWAPLCRMMYAQSLTPEGCFHLLKGDCSSDLPLNLSLRRVSTSRNLWRKLEASGAHAVHWEWK